MKNSIDKLTSEAVETLTSTGDALLSLGAATFSATLHTTELTARSAYLTVDTMDYGLKAVLTHMPEDAEDLIKKADTFIDELMAEAEKLDEEEPKKEKTLGDLISEKMKKDDQPTAE
jgi:hypothetical protein